MTPAKEQHAYIEATAEAYVASVLCVALLPSGWLFLAPLSAIAILVAAWFSRIPLARKGDATFAPDPLAPDFKPLLALLAGTIEGIQAGDGKARIHLMPMLGPDGRPAPYALDWSPTRSCLEVTHSGVTTSCHCAARIRPNALLPIIVAEYPVTVEAEMDSGGWRVLLGTRQPFLFRRLFNRDPTNFAKVAYAIYVSTIMCLCRYSRSGDGLAGMRVAVAMVAPVVLVRLWAFRSRIHHAVAQNSIFLARLFKRH